MRIWDILLLSLAYRYYRHTGCNCQENEQDDFVPVYFYLESESDSLKSIQRFTNFPVFFLPDIRYRLSRNRNLKYGNRISRSGTNTWFLFRSTPTFDECCSVLTKSSPKTSESDSSVFDEDCLFCKLFVGVLRPSELSHVEQSSPKELLEELLQGKLWFSTLSEGGAWFSRLSIDEHPWSSRLLLLD